MDIPLTACEGCLHNVRNLGQTLFAAAGKTIFVLHAYYSMPVHV